MSKNIALLTDFGDFDNYVGVLKGVILSINPDANIIDITHKVEPQNILQASWVLKTSYKYYPKGTIFLSIVDPGVGSNRKRLLVKTSEYYFIAPDNGLLGYIFEDIEKIINIENSRFFLDEISSTFHGRDIFAPVAAYLSQNKYDLEEFGSNLNINEVKKLSIITPQKVNSQIVGQIVNIDHFGNIITNIPASFLSDSTKLYLKELHINIYKNYTEAAKGELLAIAGSSDTLEISQNCGSAQNTLSLKIGDQIKIELE
ncbi:MAG: hypothetical protein A2287_10645 [Candidatus Melainabacteria bacterium RIFOXYA12_FULL_32_12]|nr:MAG: hypothetical protein A2255_06650 [Candidatus Melainabacteria bacterium RIFOXYA2_FULL_32_9]OGI28741.1 MAG: hypothetical protein A2287_10645 [Candidatus Melainabacteria bacterium RIFOXYA12_FULL_32_12]